MRTDRVADLPDGPKTTEEQEDWILAPYLDYLGDGTDEEWARLFDFMQHSGMDLAKVQADPRSDLSARDVILDHYRLPDGTYDVDKVVGDLLSQPHIQECIAKEREKITARRQQKAESKRRRREAKRASVVAKS